LGIEFYRAPGLEHQQQGLDLCRRPAAGFRQLNAPLSQRADLPRENYDRVFKRMVSQRNLEASLLRAEGEERAQEIRATAEKEARVIRAAAQREAEIIRGEGDKQRNAIYAAAYSKDPEFFAFYRSMEAYKKGLGTGTTYVLSPNSDFLGYLDDQGGPRR